MGNLIYGNQAVEEETKPDLVKYELKDCGCKNPEVQSTDNGRHQSCLNCGWKFNAFPNECVMEVTMETEGSAADIYDAYDRKIWSIGNQDHYGIFIETHKIHANYILDGLNRYLENKNEHDDKIKELIQMRDKFAQWMKTKNYI